MARSRTPSTSSRLGCSINFSASDSLSTARGSRCSIFAMSRSDAGLCTPPPDVAGGEQTSSRYRLWETGILHHPAPESPYRTAENRHRKAPRIRPRSRRGSARSKASFRERNLVRILQPRGTLATRDVPITDAHSKARHTESFDQCLMPVNRERVSVLVAKDGLD
jgi:hypothetical protein